MVGVMDQAFFQQQAVQMAHVQAGYLLRNVSRLSAETAVSYAVHLINDCVHHLDLPTLALQVALGLHPVIERWAAWESWAAALDTLLALGDQAYPVSDRIRLLHDRNHAACELGDCATATAIATTALELAEALGDQTLIALSLHELALAAYHYDDFGTAQTYWERAYAFGHAHVPPVKVGHICMNLGLIAEQRGFFAKAYRRFDQAHNYYHSQNDRHSLARVQCNIANVQRKEGRLEDAATLLQLAGTTLHQIGARYEYALAANNLGYVYLAGERYAQALQAFQLALHTFEAIGALSEKALVLSNMAELYVTTAAWDQAVPRLQEARELAVACGKPLLVAAISVDEGRMLAARGDYDAARQVWEGALAVQEAKGAWHAAQHTRQLLDTLPTSAPSVQG
jgi:tetratricopeptide (TPR) repeat protein